MVLVANEAQLLAAVAAQQSPLEITASFQISAQINVNYSTVITSQGPGIQTLSKVANFPLPGYMFNVINGATVTFQNITLDGNLAGNPEGIITNRSLISAQGGTVILDTNLTLQNNYAFQEGGGFYLRGLVGTPSGFIMRANATITGCISRTSGGGVMIARRNVGDSVTISGSVAIVNNRAQQGGGIFSSCYVDGVGSDLTIGDSVQIANNTAIGNGGGIYYTNLTNNSVPVSLLITGNASILGNQASGGAGVFFLSTNSLDQYTITAAPTFTNNTAGGNGGGSLLVANTGGANLTVTGGVFTGNSASIAGGLGVSTQTGGTVNINGAQFLNNQARSGAGGGFFYNNTSTTIPSTVTISAIDATGNQAGSNGGGIFVNGGPSLLTFNFDNSTIDQNRSGQSGGGVLINNDAGANAIVTINRITNNQAGQAGGGFFFANQQAGQSTLQLSSNTLTTNTAQVEGGGLRLTGGLGVLNTTIQDCTIEGNVATTGNGGGVWFSNDTSHLIVTGSTFINANRSLAANGGGIYFNTSPAGTLSLSGNVVISNNQAGMVGALLSANGGGVCVITGSSSVESSVQIINNQAGRNGGGYFIGGEGTHTFSGGTISGNVAGLSGGGIFQSGDTQVNLSGGIISNNRANANGGGYFVTANGVANLVGGSITANSAVNGGGLYISNNGTATLSDGNILANNTADALAPGVFSGGILNVAGNRELSNGLYILGLPNVAQIIGPLAGSVIQLNGTPYVSTNPQGTPVVVAIATPAYPTLTEADADAFLKPLVGFDGWEVRLEGTTQVVIAPIVYTITYVGLFPGQANPNPPTYTVIDLPIVLQDPEQIPGQQFLGFFDEAGNRVTVIPVGTTGNLVLTARFAEDQFLLTFFANDADGPPATNIPDPIPFAPNQIITIPLQIPLRPGFRFISWNTAPDGSGITYLPGQSFIAPNSDLNLFAQYIPLGKPDYYKRAEKCRRLREECCDYDKKCKD